MFILHYQHHHIHEIYCTFTSSFETDSSKDLIVPAFSLISVGEFFHRKKGLECEVDHLPAF